MQLVCLDICPVLCLYVSMEIKVMASHDIAWRDVWQDPIDLWKCIQPEHGICSQVYNHDFGHLREGQCCVLTSHVVLDHLDILLYGGHVLVLHHVVKG